MVPSNKPRRSHRYYRFFFNLLVAVEAELRKWFPATVSSVGTFEDNMKAHAIQNIMVNVDVLFHSEIVSVNWCTELDNVVICVNQRC